jgi:RimJ/RimL family protein N-acetyltransferase
MCQEHHTAAIRLMEGVGFSKEGLMRKYMYKNGEHINEWLYSIIDEDYLVLKEKENI